MLRILAPGGEIHAALVSDSLAPLSKLNEKVQYFLLSNLTFAFFGPAAECWADNLKKAN